ncbi:glycerol-3-phosphate 1-O-acyltransferase PlsY [Marinivivus vitaminiproducens]|uniref:glycerol-3-phosphate 1-O-acyltransferase PlsY n=1 Tax=Marinivivus vitaminiproducens TaxID=3035935 RepID=UPI00279F1BF4|nr:glycerol-3-phosphate 1-O-acyltransferase PlsY [Geminicoccaceae bacterium SCSIO 64248]
MTLSILLAAVIGYLCGSIPSGVILTRLGKAGDLRSIGSGSIGATNVLRTGRKGLAALTLAIDALKGGLPAWIGWHVFSPETGAVVAAFAVIGHCFPVWLGFRGGKGVGTSAGVLLALGPLAFLIALAVFVLLVWLTRYVSLGSMAASVVAVIVAWAQGDILLAQLFAVLAVIIIAKHAGNIGRLLRGEENRLSFAKKG